MKQMRWIACWALIGISIGCASKRDEKIIVASGKDQTLTEGLMTESQLRTELMSYSDTATTRVNQLCDEIARKSLKLDVRSRANLEKITFTQICIENAAQPKVVAGLSDMIFQVTMKARAAQRRVDSIRAAATQESPTTAPVTTMATSQPAESMVDPFDLYAQQFQAVYKLNNDEIWYLAKRALPDATYNTLATSMNKWLDAHPDLRYATARTSELRPFVPEDSETAFSVIDMKSTLDQIDRGIWMAQRLPDQLRWQTDQVMLDAFKLLASEREATLQNIGEEVTRQRTASIDQLNLELNTHIDAIIKKLDAERAKAFQEGFHQLGSEREKTIIQATQNADALVAKSIDHFFAQLRIILIGVGIAIVGLLIAVILFMRRRTRR